MEGGKENKTIAAPKADLSFNMTLFSVLSAKVERTENKEDREYKNAERSLWRPRKRQVGGRS